MSDPGAIALSIAGAMQWFGTGELAALRRFDAGASVPAYWRLATRHDSLHHRHEEWVPIVQALALLMPKGAVEERKPLHTPNRPLGMALCDGGERNWPGEDGSPRPMLSERRLAQLLAARGAPRRVLLLRAVRMLAARREPAIGIDVPSLAWAFLNPDPARIAEPYYGRLDRAERAAASEKDEENQNA